MSEPTLNRYDVLLVKVNFSGFHVGDRAVCIDIKRKANGVLKNTLLMVDGRSVEMTNTEVKILLQEVGNLRIKTTNRKRILTVLKNRKLKLSDKAKRLIMTFLVAVGLSATSMAAPDSLWTGTADTTAVKDTVRDPLTLDVYLYSRYVWRGVQFGTGPTVQAQVGFTQNGFMAACYVAKSLNGTTEGFPNTSNLMVGYQYKGVSIVVDDYFFYDEDNLDRYLDWSDTTLHFIEGRLRYDGSRCYAMVAYNIYGAQDIDKALYVEGGYKFPEHGLTVFAGYLTGRSTLNFCDAQGVTNIGLTKEKNIKMSDNFTLPLSGSLVINPSYKDIVDLPGVRRNFLTLVVGVHF